MPGLLLSRWALTAALTCGCQASAAQAPAAEPKQEAAREIVAQIRSARGSLTLLRDDDGNGHLEHQDAAGVRRKIQCERLEGAWGLWAHDVDGDGRREALVALRKRARFDPSVENRLHVYGLEGGRCVPVWRGTRLAGRFDDLAVADESPGVLVAWERVGEARRVASYRWSDFGYELTEVLWRGRGLPPRMLRARFASLSSSIGENDP